LIIGGRGAIGKKFASHFSENNEVIIAGRNSGDVNVDIADSKSISEMFKTVNTNQGSSIISISN